MIASVIISIGYFFLNIPVKKNRNRKQGSAFIRVGKGVNYKS